MTAVPAGEPGYAYGSVIHEAVVRHAVRTPAATAVVQAGRALTYAELDRASDDYAAHLAEAGVGPGSRVPVVLPRSLELVAVILAVLKRGAAYAALDPRWPARGIARLAARLDAPLTVTEARPVARALRDGRRAPVVPCDGSAPAMVFFTSGTTGEPKGVLSPHRATTRLFPPSRPGGPRPFARFGPGHVTAVAAPVSWDAFTLELWGPLISGGTAVLSEDGHPLPASLATLVGEYGVDTAWLTASLFHTFVDEDVSCFRGLRHLLTGGERLSPAHVRAFLDAHPAVALTNGYGPVESCVFATTRRVEPSDPDRATGVPLGTPVPHTRVHVLRDGRPCPAYEVGEIHVGGAGLAVGYLDDPAETAARFVRTEVRGATVRLYRTGDLGFLDEDGVLHYRGRQDRQVKIRGHRVEPQEIEVFCESLAGVRRAVVVPVPAGDRPGFDRMALFCLPGHRSPVVSAAALRERLRAGLPAHCVPDEIEVLGAFPLTQNGKVDHRELLARATRDRAVPPRDAGTANDPRDVVARAFREVLRLPEVDPDAPFAALGGTSLDAIRLCARLQASFGAAVSVAKFLRDPSLSGVLALLASAHPASPPGPAADGQHRTARSDRDVPGGTPSDRNTPSRTRSAPYASTRTPSDRVPLSGMQAGLCMMHEVNPDDPAPICPMVWRVRGAVDLAALAAALDDLHARHEALRAAYFFDDEPVAVVGGPPGRFRLDRLEPRPTEAEALAAMTRRLLRPLRIEAGEVWRGAVLRLDQATCLLGIAVHHIAFDGWSEAVLIAELTTAYGSRARGRVPEFARPAPGLWDVARENAFARDEADAAAQLARQARALAGVPELRLPPPADPAASRGAGTARFVVGPPVVAELAAAAREMGGTLFLPLLSCYAAALARVLGQPDFCVGVPAVRRAGPASLEAVSCLMDVVCVRLPPLGPFSSLRGESLRGERGRQGLRGLLAAARPAVEQALACQDTGVADLVRELNPPRTGRNPLYQTLFAYQSNEVPRLRLGDRTAEPVPAEPGGAMAELVCEAWPTHDGGLRVDLTYRRDAVAAGTVRRIAHVYRALLLGAGGPYDLSDADRDCGTGGGTP